MSNEPKSSELREDSQGETEKKRFTFSTNLQL